MEEKWAAEEAAEAAAAAAAAAEEAERDGNGGETEGNSIDKNLETSDDERKMKSGLPTVVVNGRRSAPEWEQGRGEAPPSYNDVLSSM